DVGGVPEVERWVERQRAAYAARAAAVVEALAREAGRRQESGPAAEWWRRLADMDPLNSRVAAELVTALAAAGNVAGALRYAREHDAMVREELGVAPDAVFASAVRRLRAGGAGPARPGPTGALPAAPPGPRPPTSPRRSRT